MYAGKGRIGSLILTHTAIWYGLIVTGSAPTNRRGNWSLMGRRSRIFTEGLEIIDLEEGRIDLFLLEGGSHAIVQFRFQNDVSLVCLRILDTHRLISRRIDGPALLGSEGAARE